MYITKTNFMNFIRCPLYNKFLKHQKGFNISNEIIDDIRLEIMERLEDFEDEEMVDEYLEAMLPYYKDVEIYAAKYLESKYTNIKYSINTKDQQSFERKINDNIYLCYIDIFHQAKDHFKIFEVKATTTKKFLSLGAKEDEEAISIFSLVDGIYHLKEETQNIDIPINKYEVQRNKLKDLYHNCGRYVYDLALQRYIIEGDLDTKNKYYLAVLNSDYVFDGKYKNEEPLYDLKKMISLIDLTLITSEMKLLIKDDLKKIEEYLKSPVSSYALGKYCGFKKTYECSFKNQCFTFLKHEHPITGYIESHHGFKYGTDKIMVYESINQGKGRMEDIPYEYLNRKKNQIQLDCILHNEEYLNIEKIRCGIKQIKYPIYHLDFESFPSPLPRYFGEKCYNQSVFQYSLHIEEENGNCEEHYEFLAKDLHDHRQELVESLIKHIKPGGTVMVYNETFEKGRIKEFINFFPKYEKQLSEIYAKIFDLMHLIKGNKKLFITLGCNDDLFNYYHPKQNGSYSIKTILPLFSNLTYKNLNVKNGLEAVSSYLSFKNKFNEKTYQDMLKYCGQDTYSMYLVFKRLKEKICLTK